MAPSDFHMILIHGWHPSALPNNYPLLAPSFNPCSLCLTPTLHKCSRCSGAPYCSVQHENAHWDTHRRSCASASADQQDSPVTARRATIRPLKCYEVGPNEALPMVKGLYFSPYKEHSQEVDVRYRPTSERMANDRIVGPCPVLGSYFPNDTPQCALIESDGDHTIDQPFAIWYSEKSLKSGKLTNMAILSLFDPQDQQRERLWCGSVVVMRFASWNYHQFVPVTSNDISYLKIYFSNYVRLQEAW